MQEFYRRVTSVRAVPHAEETSSALLAGATVIPLADTGEFTDYGGHVRILGTVYEYVDMDEGDVSGTPSITLATGLLADVPAETLVEEWNETKEEVVTDWVATIVDEDDGSVNEALLTHALIALIATGIPVVGEAVTVRVDDVGDWWVTEVHGATPGYDPGFIRTGGLGADTVVWAGEENGRRAQLDGIDGALECFDSTNTQTVNLDGEDNYIEGTLATAASGPRVEIGPGDFALPTNEIRMPTDDALEIEAAVIRSHVTEIDPGFPQGSLVVSAAEWDGDSSNTPYLGLLTSSSDTGSDTRATVEADSIRLLGETARLSVGVSVQVSSGNLDATMGAGSVGEGTFRDSVDARVNTLVPAASDTTAGKVELATSAETTTGTDTARAVTPAGIAAMFDDMGHIERSPDGTQSITSGGSAQAVLWQTSAVTGRGGVSYNSGTGAFTVTTPGTYTVSAWATVAANATNRRQFLVRHNGNNRSNTINPAPASGAWAASGTITVDCAASDTFDVAVFQDSGISLAISNGYITVHRVA